MNKFFIYYFRENNSDGEYIVMSEEDLSKEDIEGHELLTYKFHSKIECSTNSPIHSLPYESIMMKQS